MMTFLAPGFAWAFLIPAAIVVLYLLRRRYTPRNVPSTFLWQRSVRDHAANHPFQKLRRNLLLPLQLLAAVLLVFGLMRPSLTGGTAGRSVLVLDVSGSMMARSGDKTRMEEAKEQARQMVRNLPAGERITVLAAGDTVRRVVLDTQDKDVAERAISELEPAMGGADLAKALKMAEAIGSEDAGEGRPAGAAVTVFSDSCLPPEGVSAVNVGRGEANRAVVLLTAEDGKAYARVANYGPDCTVSLTCEADGVLVQAKEMEIPEGETAGVSFGLPAGTKTVAVAIREADALPEDNRAQAPVTTRRSRRIVLAADNNLFLESALKVREDWTVVRADEESLGAAEADLYIWGNGPVVFSRNPSVTAFSWPDQAKAAELPLTPVDGSPVTAGVTMKDVALREYYPISGGKAFLLVGEDPAAALTETEAVIGFDLHASNLPLKYDFPILVQNLAGALLADLPEDQGTEETEATILMPAEESDIRTVAPSVAAEGTAAAEARGTDLTAWFLLGFLLLLLAEMGVSRFVC